MFRTAFITLAALSLAACGETGHEADHDTMDHGNMDHGAMEHATPSAEALAPLPDDGVSPVINIRAAWMRPHPNGRDVTAAYVVVRLDAGAADRLTGAMIDGAERVELHGHIIGEGGMMQMRPIGPQDVTNEGPLVFTPGGRHLMVFGLPTVVEGDSVNGQLMFERAGTVDVTFEVRAMPPGNVTDY